MIITEVRPILADRYLLVEITTDDGITGVGESGAWGFLGASANAIELFGRYLVGKDPLLIEHHWQYMYRSSHFRGAAIMGALSAIDIALWDIAGKHYNAPVYALLGGPVRHRARAYLHVFGESKDALVAGAEEAKASGFTAVGHLNPLLDIPFSEPYFETHAQKIGNAIATVQEIRAAVGREIDLCIEIHRRLSPTEAVQLGLGIESTHPIFIEDPVLPDNFDDMAYVADKINIAIATGERLTTPWEFAMLLRRNAVQHVRPDVCLVGGISGAKKIAALAEASHVGVVPHNPLSPVSTAACLQIAAAVPNLVLQEFPLGEEEFPKRDMVRRAYEYDGDGFLRIPTSPGIGIELNTDSVRNIPPAERAISTRLHVDGSVVDQ